MTAHVSASAPSRQRFPRGVHAPSPRSGLRPVLEHGYTSSRLILYFRGVYAPSRCAALAVELRRLCRLTQVFHDVMYKHAIAAFRAQFTNHVVLSNIDLGRVMPIGCVGQRDPRE